MTAIRPDRQIRVGDRFHATPPGGLAILYVETERNGRRESQRVSHVITEGEPPFTPLEGNAQHTGGEWVKGFDDWTKLDFRPWVVLGVIGARFF